MIVVCYSVASLKKKRGGRGRQQGQPEPQYGVPYFATIFQFLAGVGGSSRLYKIFSQEKYFRVTESFNILPFTTTSAWLCFAGFLACFFIYFKKITCNIMECFFALIVSFLCSAFTDTEKLGCTIF